MGEVDEEYTTEFSGHAEQPALLPVADPRAHKFRLAANNNDRSNGTGRVAVRSNTVPRSDTRSEGNHALPHAGSANRPIRQPVRNHRKVDP